MATDRKVAQEAAVSLDRIKSFDPSDLIQSERLGAASDFSQAVEPSRRLIRLFDQIPTSFLSELPDQELSVIKERSDSLFQIFDEVLNFDPELGDNRGRREALVEKLIGSYQRNFTALYPLISFSISRTVDFNSLEDQGRAAVRSIQDQTNALIEDIERGREEAAAVLEEARKTAAESGAAREAVYFRDQADEHNKSAESWRIATIWMAVAVGLYGALTLVFHQIPLFRPTNLYETIQISIGKVLVFFVLGYMLALCARNFLSNRHNEIVNRHRQNALLTYRAIASAASTPDSRDVILNHAASAIYGLHDTGYTKPGDGGGASAKSIVEMLPRTPVNLNSPS